MFSCPNSRLHSHNRLVFQPLEDVVRNLRSVLMSELEAALSQQVGISTIFAFATENV